MKRIILVLTNSVVKTLIMTTMANEFEKIMVKMQRNCEWVMLIHNLIRIYDDGCKYNDVVDYYFDEWGRGNSTYLFFFMIYSKGRRKSF